MGFWKFLSKYWKNKSTEIARHDEGMAIWLDSKTSQIEKYRLMDDLSRRRDPESGAVCPICGTVSYSTYVAYEIGKPDKNGNRPILHVNLFTNCGHVDSSIPAYATEFLPPSYVLG